MTLFVIELPVEAADQADARDLADGILKATRIALMKGQHPRVTLSGTIAVATARVQVDPDPEAA